MGRQKRKGKDKKVLLNYDPSRYDVPVEKIQPVRFIKSDGSDEFTLLVPANELDGKSEEEKNSILLDRFRIFTFIRSFDWEKCLPDQRLLPDITSRFALFTARAIALNAVAIYLERAKTEEVVDRREEPDSEALFLTCQNLTERIHHNLNKAIMDSQESAKALDWQLFSNIFASVLLNIHRLQKSVFSMSPGEVQEAVRSHLTQHSFKAYEDTIEAMAEDYAAQLLDRLCPVKMPIEELRSFIFAKADSGILLSLSELNRFLANLQRKQGKEIVCRVESDGQHLEIGLKLHSPIDPLKLIDGPVRERSYTKEHFRELAVAAVKEMARRNNSLTKKHLCVRLGISDTTLNNYLKDDPDLWPLLQKTFVEARLKKLHGI